MFLDEEHDISEAHFKPKPGDRVQVNLDCDIFEAMQQDHGGWHPVLAKVSLRPTQTDMAVLLFDVLFLKLSLVFYNHRGLGHIAPWLGSYCTVA